MLKYEFADVNGVRLHYARAGQGKLILFVHGFPEFWYAWKDLLPEFGRDHLAVAPDMRGYNLSSKPTDVTDYAVPHLVDDLRCRGATAAASDERDDTEGAAIVASVLDLQIRPRAVA